MKHVVIDMNDKNQLVMFHNANMDYNFNTFFKIILYDVLSLVE